MVVRESISIHTWVSPEYEQLIRDNCPDYVQLSNGANYELFWTQGKPVVNRFNLSDIDALPEEGVFVSAGCEVLFSHKNNNGDTRRMKASSLKKAVGKI